MLPDFDQVNVFLSQLNTQIVTSELGWDTEHRKMCDSESGREGANHL